MLLQINDREIAFEYGQTYAQVLKQAGLDEGVLAMRVGGETVPLTQKASPEVKARALTYADDEGRMVYERSLRFVFLLAASRVYPGRRVRLEHSVGQGIYVSLSGGEPLTVSGVEQMEREMRELIARDSPFTRHEVSRQEAIAYFAGKGQMDKVQLLRYRPYETFQLFQLEDMMEYFYGVMAPSTGYVPVFGLKLHLPGLILQLPEQKHPSHVAPARNVPKLMQTFAESARWNEILGCNNAADLNDMTTQKHLREFIRVNEALHEKSISAIADRFVASGARLILIAGPSSSGKTTFTNRLAIALRVLGRKPMLLSLDDYYRNRDDIPVDENGERDLERLDTLDVELFNEHLVRLLQGEEIQAPIFEFKTGSRSEKTRAVRVAPDQPILVEGIHGLNDELTKDVPRPLKFKIYISALTTLNLDDHNRIRTTDARLLRRMVRDYHFRGTMPEETMAMWPSVKRGEANYIFPYQEEADVMFNSSLVYEMAILKKYVYPMLALVEESSPYYTLARRLVKFLNYFVSSDVEDEIPPNSILREFIGGCCFYRKED